MYFFLLVGYLFGKELQQKRCNCAQYQDRGWVTKHLPEAEPRSIPAMAASPPRLLILLVASVVSGASFTVVVNSLGMLKAMMSPATVAIPQHFMKKRRFFHR